MVQRDTVPLTDYEVMRGLQDVRLDRWGFLAGAVYFDGSQVRHEMPRLPEPVGPRKP